ncbi:MAG: hypothetical protein QXW44_02685 [Pyrobaculum sp.]
MDHADVVRRRVVEHGASIKDKVIETLTHSYNLIVEQIKSISQSYRDLDTFLLNISNIKGLDFLVIYILLVGILHKYRNLEIEELRQLAAAYEKNIYEVFSASRARRALEEVGIERDVADSVISDLAKALNTIGRNRPIYKWVARQKRVSFFEEEIRRVVFRGEGGGRVGRGVKTILRLFIHESNIPLALKIAYTPEYKKYVIHGDMYTALVTLRSGAFEDLDTLTSQRVKLRVAKRIICENREGGGRCRDVTLRLESIRGLVRYVGKVSGDPVLYERGAYDIGVNYCKELKCDVCPIKDVCRRYIFIKLR